MGWNDVQESRGGGNAAFLQLKDGDVRKIHIIDDEPHSFSSVFFNAIKRSAVVDPNDNPVKGIKGFDTRTRHAINVYDYDDQTVKVLAGSNEMFNQLKAIHGEWEGFENVDLKISRKGTGFDTKYQIVPTPKCIWDPSLIDGQEVHDLGTVFAVTPREIVEQYMEGVDVSTESNPDELEDEPATEDTVEEPIEEVEEPAPKPKAVVKPAHVPTKAPLGRNDLILKINHAVKNKLRYKKQGVWLTDVQKFGGKDKKSMSQLSQEALDKLYRFVQTVK